METLTSFFGFVPYIAWQLIGYAIVGFIAAKILNWVYKQYIKPHSEPWIKWGNQTALLLGWPMLLILLFTCISKLTFTATCLSVGDKCQYALGVSDMAQQYLTNLVGGEAEVVVTPKKG